MVYADKAITRQISGVKAKDLDFVGNSELEAWIESNVIPAVEKVVKAADVVQHVVQAGLVFEYKGPDEIRKLMESGIQIVKEVAPRAGLIK